MQKKSLSRGLIYTKLIHFADPAQKGKAGLTCSEKCILLAIADHIGHNQTGWPSFQTIAHFAGMNRSTAIRNIRSLQKRGILTIIENDDRESNEYRLNARAIYSLITEKKYQKRAKSLLEKLLGDSGSERPTSGVTPLPQLHDATTLVARRHQGSGVTPPERPPIVPLSFQGTSHSPSEPEWDSSSRKKGAGEAESIQPSLDSVESATATTLTKVRKSAASHSPDRQSPGSVADYIHSDEVVEIVRTAESQMDMEVKFTHNYRLPGNKMAASVVELFKRWKEELGSYPESWMIAATVKSKPFQRLKEYNWGIITSPSPVQGGTPYRERLYTGVVEQWRAREKLNSSYNRVNHTLARVLKEREIAPDRDDESVWGPEIEEARILGEKWMNQSS